MEIAQYNLVVYINAKVVYKDTDRMKPGTFRERETQHAFTYHIEINI